MRRRVRWFAAGAAVAVAIAGAATQIGPARAESNGGVRVMPLGDSITDGVTIPGAYRTGLWQRVVDGRYTVDFVGSLSNGPAGLGDHDHEGHSGWRIDQIDANIVPWLRSTTPHSVLLHIGTNDMGQNPAGAPDRLSTLIDHITSTVPDAEVFVATIIPLANGLEGNARAFNAAIPGIVQSKMAGGKHVHLVDMHSALTTADLLPDGIHPNAGGFDKMAATWFDALQSVPGSIGDPTGPGPSPTPTTTPPAVPGCQVRYDMNAWSNGFVAGITIVNTGTSTINGWALVFTLPAGQIITTGWNATYTPASGQVTARNVSYDATIPTNGSVEIGFQATHSGSTAAPGTFTLNGTTCSVG